MTRTLPHKGPRSRASKKRSTGRSADPDRRSGAYLPDRILDLPKIFVQIPRGGYLGYRYAAAKIVLKRRCYRYLVWRDGKGKRQLYLGKVKVLAPHFPRSPGAAAPDQAGAGDRYPGVQK